MEIALDENKSVEVKILPIYEDTSMRPVSFVVRYKIEEERVKIVEFDK